MDKIQIPDDALHTGNDDEGNALETCRQELTSRGMQFRQPMMEAADGVPVHNI